MKYLKKFEKQIEPKFKIGEIVYCIDDQNISIIKSGKKYKIEDIVIGSGMVYYTIGNSDYRELRFISELEYTTNKYNL